uniref:ANAPC4_WD40 domain-containing protein n=2 Tax=Panagrellus redivivus TaxID=6233 RepID=A0A7E4ZSI9_PANRE
MTAAVADLPYHLRAPFASSAYVAGDASCVFSPLTSATMHIRPLSRKRGYDDSFDDADDDVLDFNTAGVPAKLSRHEVRPEDVAACDVQWSFEIDDGSRSNINCTIDDNRLIISTVRPDSRIEKRILGLPDHVDTNSVLLCFDAKGNLLVGFDFLPGHRCSRTIHS